MSGRWVESNLWQLCCKFSSSSILGSHTWSIFSPISRLSGYVLTIQLPWLWSRPSWHPPFKEFAEVNLRQKQMQREPQLILIFSTTSNSDMWNDFTCSIIISIAILIPVLTWNRVSLTRSELFLWFQCSVTFQSCIQLGLHSLLCYEH